MEPQTLRPPGESLEVRAAWFAAVLSTLLAGVAFLPSVPLRALALSAGAACIAVLSPAYLRRATPLSTLVITVSAALLSTTVVVRLSGVSWSARGSASQAGGIHGPAAWLFTATAWCLAVGLLATGRLVAQAGRRAGHLGPRGYRLAQLMPAVACVGFVIVGACHVGGGRALSVVHNLAAVTAMGCFVVGMLVSPWLPGLSRPLRLYSAAAAVVVFTAWLPTGLRFLGIIETSPISTLNMELLAFALSFGWLGWLARGWGASQP